MPAYDRYDRLDPNIVGKVKALMNDLLIIIHGTVSNEGDHQVTTRYAQDIVKAFQSALLESNDVSILNMTDPKALEAVLPKMTDAGPTPTPGAFRNPHEAIDCGCREHDDQCQPKVLCDTLCQEPETRELCQTIPPRCP